MWRRSLTIMLTALCVSGTAFADPPQPQARREHAASTAAEAAHEEHPGIAKQDAVKAMQGALQRAARDHERKQRQRALQRRLNGRELSGPIRMELRNHARRTSRLQRIRQLAVTADPALLARIDRLVALESGRHERHLTNLITRANAAGPTRVDDHEQDDEVEE
jgi:hypothetical protein